MRSASRRACLWLAIAQTLIAVGVQGLHDHHSARSVGAACDDARLHIERRDGIEPSSKTDDCLACRVRADVSTEIDTPEPIDSAPPSEPTILADPSAPASFSHTQHAIRAPPAA